MVVHFSKVGGGSSAGTGTGEPPGRPRPDCFSPENSLARAAGHAYLVHNAEDPDQKRKERRSMSNVVNVNVRTSMNWWWRNFSSLGRW